MRSNSNEREREKKRERERERESLKKVNKRHITHSNKKS